jgi:phospholipid/cholesterol/gamma-HCH transport system substrate-binding protein
MSNDLSRRQTLLLGVVVLVSVALGTLALVTIASKQGLWKPTFELRAAFPEVHDITPGTPVRIRGVDAGQVLAIEYPDSDGPIGVRFRVDAQFQSKLFADASAQIQPTGLLGAKVINISPGTPANGPLVGNTLAVAKSSDLAALTQQGEELLKELRTLVADTRGTVKRVDGVVESEVANVRDLVKDGRSAIGSVRQNSEAVAKLPIVRNYVESPASLMVRPDLRRESINYSTADLFEPNSAILSEMGRSHLENLSTRLKNLTNAKTEVVIVAARDPMDSTQTATSAELLTKKQAEAVVEYLKTAKATKIGWWTHRKVNAIGLGTNPSPVVEPEKLPPSYLQVLLFTPP